MRSAFQADLDELHLQVEVMALRVGQALERAVDVLETGNQELALQVIDGDDEIDAMLVSLSTRCYDIIARQQPVAADLRLVVSVLRVLTEFERVGDLCLRIANLAPQQPLWAANDRIFAILRRMAIATVELYHCASSAWSGRDAELAASLAARDDALNSHYVELTEAILELEARGSVPLAVAAVTAGRTLERIADHCVLIGIRLLYLLTGDATLLGEEAR